MPTTLMDLVSKAASSLAALGPHEAAAAAAMLAFGIGSVLLVRHVTAPERPVSPHSSDSIEYDQAA